MTCICNYDSAKFKLGTLCKRNHAWPGTNQSLRRNKPKGDCLECEKIHIANRPNTPEAKERHRQIVKNRIQTGKVRDYKATIRQSLREKGLTSRGTTPILNPRITELQHAILNAGKFPSVAKLVIEAQHMYWKENPSEYKKHQQKWNKAKWWLLYNTKPELRLYHREKSKRRKALAKSSMVEKITVTALRKRFDEFNNCCAYCGKFGDMQIEHVKPLSKGGLHSISNIVPACSGCNYSKRDKDMEQWYRYQSFFDELRFQRICAMLQVTHNQLMVYSRVT